MVKVNQNIIIVCRGQLLDAVVSHPQEFGFGLIKIKHPDDRQPFHAFLVARFYSAAAIYDLGFAGLWVLPEGDYVLEAHLVYRADQGGKVGMREAELQKLYNNALQASPHKYTDGKYLSIAASGVAPTKLVFETDAQGVVTEWRVGLVPEVDYVEGCS